MIKLILALVFFLSLKPYELVTDYNNQDPKLNYTVIVGVKLRW